TLAGFFFPAGAITLSLARRAFGAKPPSVAETAESVPAPHRPLTFGQRVRSHMVAHVIISLISGALGFNILIAAGTIVLSIPLWIMGARVEFPDHVRGTIDRGVGIVKEGMGGVRDEASDRLARKKAELEEEIKEREEALKARVKAEQEELKERAERAAGLKALETFFK
ncbi:hypothetical protein ACYOEI_10900, partial [Singulisphaera rosea]